MKPGTTKWFVPSIVAAPGGTCVDARGPAAVMRPPTITTTAFATGGPPLPSISVAPRMAKDGDGCARIPTTAAAVARTRVTAVLRMAGIIIAAMKTCLVIVAAGVVLTANIHAADPPGFALWKASELH